MRASRQTKSSRHGRRSLSLPLPTVRMPSCASGLAAMRPNPLSGATRPCNASAALPRARRSTLAHTAEQRLRLPIPLRGRPTASLAAANGASLTRRRPSRSLDPWPPTVALRRSRYRLAVLREALLRYEANQLQFVGGRGPSSASPAPGGTPCSARGTCVDGACRCFVGYGGRHCEARTCVDGCSSHGSCVGGACACDAGWTGATCDVRSCAVGCGGHGRCVNATCECFKGWAGDTCERPVCPGEPTPCSGNGHCAGGACKRSAPSTPGGLFVEMSRQKSRRIHPLRVIFLWMFAQCVALVVRRSVRKKNNL